MTHVPVDHILRKARERGWPTSPEGKVNHHLCSGGIARDYVNDCFIGLAARAGEGGPGGVRQDAASLGPEVASPSGDDEEPR